MEQVQVAIQQAQQAGAYITTTTLDGTTYTHITYGGVSYCPTCGYDTAWEEVYAGDNYVACKCEVCGNS